MWVMYILEILLKRWPFNLILDPPSFMFWPINVMSTVTNCPNTKPTKRAKNQKITWMRRHFPTILWIELNMAMGQVISMDSLKKPKSVFLQIHRPLLALRESTCCKLTRQPVSTKTDLPESSVWDQEAPSLIWEHLFCNWQKSTSSAKRPSLIQNSVSTWARTLAKTVISHSEDTMSSNTQRQVLPKVTSSGVRSTQAKNIGLLLWMTSDFKTRKTVAQVFQELPLRM